MASSKVLEVDQLWDPTMVLMGLLAEEPQPMVFKMTHYDWKEHGQYLTSSSSCLVSSHGVLLQMLSSENLVELVGYSWSFLAVIVILQFNHPRPRFC